MRARDVPGFFDRVGTEQRRAEAFIDLAVADVKAPGEACGLGYWTETLVEEGDVIETSTGRRYLVTDARRTQGRDPHWDLRVIVMHPDDENPEDAEVHPLYWFPRNPKR